MTTHLTTGEYKKFKLPNLAKKTRPYSNYLPKRTDANQGDIVDTFRKLGFQVALLHESGKGIFDLIVSKRGLQALVEVKDGLKVPSRRELTPAQKAFNFSWQGMRCVVTCKAEAMSAAHQMNIILAAIEKAGIKLEIVGSKEKQYQPSLY